MSDKMDRTFRLMEHPRTSRNILSLNNMNVSPEDRERRDDGEASINVI